MSVAAFDSTAGTLSYSLYNLGRAPAVADAVAAEAAAASFDGAMAALPLATAVLNETMRLFPPVTFTTRVADGTVALGGTRLPRGTWIHSATWTMQRDTKV